MTTWLAFVLAAGFAVSPALQAPADPDLDLAKAADARRDSRAALDAVNRSIDSNARPGRELALAQAYRFRGHLHDNADRYPEAIDDYIRSRELTVAIGDRKNEALALSALAGVYQIVGNIPLARETVGSSLEIGRELNDPSIMAPALHTLGILNSTAGDYRAALDNFLQSLSLRRATNNTAGIGRALLNIGNVYSAQGNYPLALEQYRGSLAIAQETGDESFEAVNYITIGNAYGRDGNYPVALENLQKSLDINREIHNDHGLTFSILNIAEVHRLQGRPAEAAAAYIEARDLADKLGHIGLRAATRLSLSKALLDQGSAAEGLATAQRALALAIEGGDRELTWDSQATIGRAQRALKQDAQAAASFDEAIANIESIRANVAGGEEEAERSFETKIVPYHAMVDLLVDQGRLADALSYAERAKGRVLLDVLHSGRVRITKAMTPPEQETERALSEAAAKLSRDVQHPPGGGDLDRLRSDLAKARRDYDAFQTSLYGTHPELRAIRGEARALTLGDARDLLPDARTALLEYVVTDSRTTLFVVTKGADETPVLESFTIAITRKELENLAESFRTRLAQRDAGFRPAATRLYDLLLKPAQARLAGHDNVIIVPETVLWNLPFQALLSGAGRYALEDHAFSYAPSLTVLREMARGRAARPRGTQSLLAVGNPAASAFAPLPDAESQVRTLSQLYGAAQSEVLVGAAAAEDRVKRDAGQYRILHLATHGVFDNASPMHSYVVLSHGAAGGKDDGLLEAREIMDLDLRADLVVLSACETARGRVGAGEGVIGLTWAFFVAGSPTTVVSQWNVESSSTTALMTAFHRNRLGNPRSGAPLSTAQALRAAALSLLKDNTSRHPFYWAGFVVVGDGR